MKKVNNAPQQANPITQTDLFASRIFKLRNIVSSDRIKYLRSLNTTGKFEALEKALTNTENSFNNL